MIVGELFNVLGFKVKDEDVKNVNKTIKDIKSFATKALGAIGIGFSLTQLNAIAEEFNGINDKLNYALEYSEDMKDVQKEILAAANNCKSSYANMVDTVVALKQANSEVFPVEEAATFVEYINKLGRSAGYSDGEISSMQSSIQRVVASGTMGASDINRIARSTPALIEKICEGLGVTREELNQMAAAGQVTGATIKQAIMNSAGSIDASFDRLDYSISDAMLNIRNQWGYFVDDLNATTGLSQTIAKGMVSAFGNFMNVLNKVRNGVVWLGDKMGGMDNLLKVIGISAATIFAVLNFSKITSGLSNILKFIGGIKIQTLAIIAVIVLLALLVEDFINFMQGNDSIIGSLLEKAGVDVDAVRQTIIGAWEKIQSFLLAAWQTIRTVCSVVWDGIKNFFAKHGDQIKSGLLAVWNIIKTVLVGLWNVIKTVATAVFGGLQSFWSKHGEQVKTSFINIWNGIKNILTAVWNVLKAVATAVFTALKVYWETWGGTIMAYFSGVWETIKAVLSAALDVLADLFAIFSDLFSGNWSQLWEDVKTLLSDIWNGMLNIISTVLTAIWNVISSIFGVIWDFISGIATSIWEAITTAFSNILTGITTTVGNIRDAIVDGFQSAIDWITSLPSQALKWGADIIQGIVDGITGAIGKVGEAVSGVANKIKSFLGFSEPEDGPLSDFHTYMPDMIDLMAKGIQKGRDTVRNALSDLTGDMSNDVQDVDLDNGEPNPKPKPTGGAGGFFSKLVDGMKVFANAAKPQAGTVSTVSGSNNVSRSVVQNVEINNKFEGDKAIQKEASGAMDRSAQDITAELKRGLAYAK